MLDLTQQDVADRMNLLGYPWLRATVSDVERNNRAVTVDELVALALVFGVTPFDLMDPRGPLRRDAAMPLEYGPDLAPVDVEYLAAWLAGELTIALVPTDRGAEWKVAPRTPEGGAAILRRLAGEPSADEEHAGLDREEDR